MHEKYIQETKNNADMAIKNEYSPKVEAQRSGLHEVQIKFKGDLSEGALRAAGADRLAVVSQTDSYYNPKDRDLVKTGELLRIREEGNHRMLTYKGPKEKSDFRKRPKFEFEIDEEIEKKFLSIYGGKVKTIKKERTLYQVDDIVFSVDSVLKLEGDKETPLGNFIEIRSTGKRANGKKIRAVLSRLGLNPDDAIKESYFDM